MSNKASSLDNQLYEYLLSVSLREPEILFRLREETVRHPRAQMQIAPEQGQLMSLLLQAIGAKKTLELGVFTGYSSLCTALTLPDDGKIVACDISEEFTAVAKRYWQEAGVAHKIDLRLAPALDTLEQLLAEGQAETFDFAFIDADKENYAHYYDRVFHLIRPGGLIAIDNVLWSGRVIQPDAQDQGTIAIREFNAKLMQDDRVVLSLVPIADGLTLVWKKTI
ncbi:MAG TPA: class I SAM-dependent methyltransferase [Trichocoleus sp.]|jgi:caffeoyl-CoA O-methyltransferase